MLEGLTIAGASPNVAAPESCPEMKVSLHFRRLKQHQASYKKPLTQAPRCVRLRHLLAEKVFAEGRVQLIPTRIQ